MTYDEAKALPSEQWAVGMKVDGQTPPFGGAWTYDPAEDELTLTEMPTR